PRARRCGAAGKSVEPHHRENLADHPGGDSGNPCELVDVAKWPSAVAKCHYRPGPSRANPRQLLELLRSCLIERHPDVGPTGYSFGRTAQEIEMWGQPSQRRRTDPGHPVEPVDAAERPLALAIRHDPSGQRGADAGQPLEL